MMENPTGYTISTLARVLQADVLQLRQADSVIEHLCTDSRRIIHAPTSIFIALHTPHRNGHAFLENCYEKGIRNFLVQEPVDPARFPEANLVLSGNTLAALQQLAAWHRQNWGREKPVIGITGSNGKTIVKEWLYQLLHNRFRVARSPKSYNSQLGVPLSVWLLQPEHELGIFEVGISQTGEMAALEAVIRPTIGILTTLGDAHDEGFRDHDEKRKEKIRLFRQCNTVIYNPAVCGGPLTALPGTRLITWGSAPGSDLQVLNRQELAAGTRLQLQWQEERFDAAIPFADEASVQNALTCIATCLFLGMPAAQLREQLPLLQPVQLRLELKKGINHCTLLNDSYSADLQSFENALALLARQTQHPQKSIVLSDLPTGPGREAIAYQVLAQQIRQQDIHRVITVGEQAQQYLTPLLAPRVPVLPFRSVEELMNALPALQFQHEALLIKGARSFQLERILPLLEEQVHETVLEINLTALARNIRSVRELLQPGVRLMAVVKAFSYGSGSYEIAHLLQDQGADYLAVAFPDEGVELRKAGITLPILVMNPDRRSFDTLLQHALEPELYSLALFDAFDAFLEREGASRYPVHIKLDTGMHRLGFTAGEMEALTQRLPGNERMNVQSVFSHLTSAEDPAADAFTAEQARLFEELSRQLATVCPAPFLRHLCNSAGIRRHPTLQYEMVRMGIALYGIGSPHTEPALTLRTTIAQVRELQPGETVGYNRKGIITRPSRIATVRIGYADGYPRNLSNGAGSMLVRGQAAPVIGTVCMDMTMLDVTAIPGAAEGDAVLVFGQDLPVETVAARAGTIPYEIITGIPRRVKRVYFEE
ncbi:MAG TPA: bifunctional UDP-N-acetylmuramoyl-tripeptide:D-alanyl-D-alanine ligase/alanine racemase [Lacibacter sp.]|nr:bifunctional UDP-N-acetylmuramoyl-tripeptide:D-alanyl-D-alanine ligase/alanine racemase [Lacibacter sp.]HMO88789.1 bifunctional UDP-N-acetylmuramoyl-tripeptide:D-alanyl-D-alanine ligase/alanine racemase [Lacibacter sp.]